MKVVKTEIEGLLLIYPKVFPDARGYFVELYNQNKFSENGIHYTFVQDNQSKSGMGTLRGLHYQRGEHAQTKLLTVVQGHILDVVVDLRENSPTFAKTFSVELKDEDFCHLLVPRDFAHGFIVLSKTAVVRYKCDNFYHPKAESGILALDADLKIDWRVPKDKIQLSEKDAKLLPFKEVLRKKDWVE